MSISDYVKDFIPAHGIINCIKDSYKYNQNPTPKKKIMIFPIIAANGYKWVNAALGIFHGIDKTRDCRELPYYIGIASAAALASAGLKLYARRKINRTRNFYDITPGSENIRRRYFYDITQDDENINYPGCDTLD